MAKVQDIRIIHPKPSETWRKGEPAASPDGKTETPGCRQAYDAQRKAAKQ